MTAKATDQGLLIPKEFLGGEVEFEIQQEARRIVVTPLTVKSNVKWPELTAEEIANDPIWDLGKDPIDDDVTDASVNLDHYLADDASGQPSSTRDSSSR